MLVANQAQQSSEPAPPSNRIQAVIDQGKLRRNLGDVAGAISLFRRAHDLAHELGDSKYEAKTDILIGSGQMLLFRYQDALVSLEQAAVLGESISDHLITGSASGNIASLLWQLGDFAAAEAKSSFAIRSLKKIAKPDQFSNTCLARSYLIHASVCFELKKNLQGFLDDEAALNLARKEKDDDLQALILDERGIAQMHEHDIKGANDSFAQAMALTKNGDRLPIEKEHLAELELEKSKPDYPLALRLISEAFAHPGPAFKTVPQYYPINIRGNILLAMGNRAGAISDFSSAVDVATEWRASALPGDTTSTQTVKELQRVYSDYAHLAAEISLEKNDHNLAEKAFMALAVNRAASLREQLRVAYGSGGHLPDEYFGKLAELQKAQTQVTLGKDTSKDRASLMQIRLDISDLENKIGIKSEKSRAIRERIPRRNSLRDIQRTLTRGQVLISISLGKNRSYLWSVTAGKVNLNRLAGEAELTSRADLFTRAIRSGGDAANEADNLTRALFSGLPADVWQRSEWLLVADGALLNGIPFSAIGNRRNGAASKFLIEDKSLRLLPSELLLVDGEPGQQNPHAIRNFVGVGDPIYNQADARLVRPSGADAKTVDAKTLADGITLARLVGSEKEIRSSARETGDAHAVLLTGDQATRENLTAALAQNAGIVHFAVHVVSPADQPQEAALALSLKDGFPELLTPEAIASLHVPGSLVVLSGCSSGQGKVLPGAGLVGLSRAWLLAGAAAVIVSSWPTPDDSGKFFASFYDHFDQLTSGNIGQRAALALRRTQLEMLRGTGYRTSPSFWGAFAVIAKE